MLRSFVELCHSRQKMELELRGKVLILNERSWARSTTLYVPPGGFEVTRRSRRDRTVLYVMGARIFGIAAAEAVLYACWVALGLATESIFEDLEASVVALFMVGLPIFAICHLIYSLIKFSRKIPTARLFIQHEDVGEIHFEFWNPKRLDKEQETLVDALEALSKDYGEEEHARIGQLGFFWQTMPPLRHGLYQAISWSFALGIALQLVRFSWRVLYSEDIHTRLPVWFWYIFLLPWIIAAVIYIYHRILMRQQPEAFRVAVRHMFKERYDESAKVLEQCMKEHPKHVPTLGLLIQLHVRQFNFDAAFQVCNTLATTAPEAAEQAQENIWIMKRLQAYMDED